MPAEFLSDEQVAAYGRFTGSWPRAELERFFFLDDDDLRQVAHRRGDHNRLGFALQLGTVRALGTFLVDPLEVPTGAVDYLAEQVGVADPSCVKAYGERVKTRLEHQWEIARDGGYREFPAAAQELVAWIDARSWTTGEGPRALFYAAVGWLREHRVLLPGVSVLTRLVSQVRDEATERLYDTLATSLMPNQIRSLEAVLAVPEGRRRSQLDAWRRGERSTTGRGMVNALDRVSQIAGLGLRGADIGAVPTRRVIELARYGIAAKAPKLARHPPARKVATLLATVRWLEVTATDDALELFDVFMAHELIGRAKGAADKEKLRRHPGYARHAEVLKRAVEVLLEADGWGEDVPWPMVRAAVETAVGGRTRLQAAVDGVAEFIPPPDADPHGEWRAAVVARYAAVRGFVRMLCQVIEFGATAEAGRVLAAMRGLADLLEARPTKAVPAGYLDARAVDVDLVPNGWWQRLVFPSDRPPGTVDRNAYVFCVLELFHTALLHRDIYAVVSDRYSDPRAKLLAGARWEAAKGPALAALQLPEDPAALLSGHTADLDAAWRAAAGGIVPDGEVRVDADGRLHLDKDEALDVPASLCDLRKRCQAMLPTVDLPELILEVMSWNPGFIEAFTPVSGGAPRIKTGLDVTVTALLSAHSLNVGYGPVLSPQDGLTRGRLGHVDQHYLRPENYAAANAILIGAQAEIALAQAWGGGLVAAVDGMRFVVPVRTVDARPNPKYFARRRGFTWLNMINDQSVGLAAKVLSGTPRDTLAVADLAYNPDGGPRPEVLITDQGSYSDVVFAILTLLGFDYRPVLADLPDAKLWRINPSTADYGVLDRAARGRVDLGKIAAHWPDILRIIASVHTREISARDVIRIVQHDGRLTALGDALAHYGRIFKTLHVLTFVEDPAYRRQLKIMRNAQEGRHGLARHVFHGRRGEVYQAYHSGMEDQLGALGLVLNAITLWNTVYLDAALDTLRAQGYPVLESDVARLWAYQYEHINVHGHYSFALPDLRGARRPLRDPDAMLEPDDDR